MEEEVLLPSFFFRQSRERERAHHSSDKLQGSKEELDLHKGLVCGRIKERNSFPLLIFTDRFACRTNDDDDLSSSHLYFFLSPERKRKRWSFSWLSVEDFLTTFSYLHGDLSPINNCYYWHNNNCPHFLLLPLGWYIFFFFLSPLILYCSSKRKRAKTNWLFHSFSSSSSSLSITSLFSLCIKSVGEAGS